MKNTQKRLKPTDQLGTLAWKFNEETNVLVTETLSDGYELVATFAIHKQRLSFYPSTKQRPECLNIEKVKNES